MIIRLNPWVLLLLCVIGCHAGVVFDHPALPTNGNTIRPVQHTRHILANAAEYNLRCNRSLEELRWNVGVLDRDIPSQRSALVTILRRTTDWSDEELERHGFRENSSYCEWPGLECCFGHSLRFSENCENPTSQSVVSIAWAGLDLRGHVPDAFDSFHDLHALDLSNNPGLKGSLPESLGHTKLITLNIANTSLQRNLSQSFDTLAKPRLSAVFEARSISIKSQGSEDRHYAWLWANDLSACSRFELLPNTNEERMLDSYMHFDGMLGCDQMQGPPAMFCPRVCALYQRLLQRPEAVLQVWVHADYVSEARTARQNTSQGPQQSISYVKDLRHGLRPSNIPPSYFGWLGCHCNEGLLVIYHDPSSDGLEYLAMCHQQSLKSTLAIVASVVLVLFCAPILVGGLRIVVDYIRESHISHLKLEFAPGCIPEERLWYGEEARCLGDRITMVMTDIQDSTALWEWDDALMQVAVDIHDRLVRKLLRQFFGYEVTTEGDSFTLAFHEAADAMRWAINLQKQLMLQNWPIKLLSNESAKSEAMPPYLYPRPRTGKQARQWMFRGLRVRVGMATGCPREIQRHPMIGNQVYVGGVADEAAFISDIATGGQMMMDAETHEQVCKQLHAEELAGCNRLAKVARCIASLRSRLTSTSVLKRTQLVQRSGNSLTSLRHASKTKRAAKACACATRLRNDPPQFLHMGTWLVEDVPHLAKKLPAGIQVWQVQPISLTARMLVLPVKANSPVVIKPATTPKCAMLAASNTVNATMPMPETLRPKSSVAVAVVKFNEVTAELPEEFTTTAKLFKKVHHNILRAALMVADGFECAQDARDWHMMALFETRAQANQWALLVTVMMQSVDWSQLFLSLHQINKTFTVSTPKLARQDLMKPCEQHAPSSQQRSFMEEQCAKQMAETILSASIGIAAGVVDLPYIDMRSGRLILRGALSAVALELAAAAGPNEILGQLSGIRQNGRVTSLDIHSTLEEAAFENAYALSSSPLSVSTPLARMVKTSESSTSLHIDGFLSNSGVLSQGLLPQAEPSPSGGCPGICLQPSLPLTVDGSQEESTACSSSVNNSAESNERNSVPCSMGSSSSAIARQQQDAWVNPLDTVEEVNESAETVEGVNESAETVEEVNKSAETVEEVNESAKSLEAADASRAAGKAVHSRSHLDRRSEPGGDDNGSPHATQAGLAALSAARTKAQAPSHVERQAQQSHDGGKQQSEAAAAQSQMAVQRPPVLVLPGNAAAGSTGSHTTRSSTQRGRSVAGTTASGLTSIATSLEAGSAAAASTGTTQSPNQDLLGNSVQRLGSSFLALLDNLKVIEAAPEAPEDTSLTTCTRPLMLYHRQKARQLSRKRSQKLRAATSKHEQVKARGLLGRLSGKHWQKPQDAHSNSLRRIQSMVYGVQPGHRVERAAKSSSDACKAGASASRLGLLNLMPQRRRLLVKPANAVGESVCAPEARESAADRQTGSEEPGIPALRQEAQDSGKELESLSQLGASSTGCAAELADELNKRRELSILPAAHKSRRRLSALFGPNPSTMPGVEHGQPAMGGQASGHRGQGRAPELQDGMPDASTSPGLQRSLSVNSRPSEGSHGVFQSLMRMLSAPKRNASRASSWRNTVSNWIPMLRRGPDTDAVSTEITNSTVFSQESSMVSALSSSAGERWYLENSLLHQNLSAMLRIMEALDMALDEDVFSSFMTPQPASEEEQSGGAAAVVLQGSVELTNRVLQSKQGTSMVYRLLCVPTSSLESEESEETEDLQSWGGPIAEGLLQQISGQTNSFLLSPGANSAQLSAAKFALESESGWQMQSPGTGGSMDALKATLSVEVEVPQLDLMMKAVHACLCTHELDTAGLMKQARKVLAAKRWFHQQEENGVQ